MGRSTLVEARGRGGAALTVGAPGRERLLAPPWRWGFAPDRTTHALSSGPSRAASELEGARSVALPLSVGNGGLRYPRPLSSLDVGTAGSRGRAPIRERRARRPTRRMGARLAQDGGV
jgi:hypothetical protein